MSATLEPLKAVEGPRCFTQWKRRAAAVSAIVLAVLFLASGLWKVSDLDATSQRMVQSLIPVSLSMPAAAAVAICEIFAGLLLLFPKTRRWGAWLASLMLLAFMIYIGALYDRLLGEDCNCFPWIQRVVGPGFFIGDAAMLLLAAVAALWSSQSTAWRLACALFLGVAALTAGSYAVTLIQQSNADVPDYATVDGRPFNLRQGHILLYFFDPECSHCYTVAREMAKQDWGAARVVVLATREPQFTQSFLDDTGLRAGISPDAATLRKIFPFTDPPYAVALHQGRAVALFNSGQMEGESYYEALRRLGHIQ
jgi:uncharacterized membrane protein